MNTTSRKAQYVSFMCLVLTVLFFVVTLILARYTNVFALNVLVWQILSGVLVWFIVLILFHQRTLAEQEKLDIAHLKKNQSEDTIFDKDREELFAVAQRRLRFFEKWMLPVFSGLVAVYNIVMASVFFIYLSRPDKVQPELKNLMVAGVITTVIAFACYLISRFATGMSAEKKWRALRAGSSVMLATGILSAAVTVFLIIMHYTKSRVGLEVLGWVIPGVLAVLGVEIIFNLILDIYRPRVAGQESRLAIDSRLLGLINEPGGILHTFASTIDYQFGFQVSQTWFYKLFEKAVIPLFIFGAVVLYLFSSVVVINPGNEAIIERLGSFENGGRLVKPGIHFKWPWPFDKVYRYDTKKIHKLTVGYLEEDPETKPASLLWGQQHYMEEYDLLVAVPEEGESLRGGAVPVSLVRANVPVLYRISNLYDYVYRHSDSRKMLEEICYRQLVRYAAGSQIEITDDQQETGRTASLLGAGREAASRILRERIQSAADDAQLGVEVVLLGLQGVHPPPDVADSYEQVIGAVQQKQASILSALADRNRTLTTLGGSVEMSNELYEKAIAFQEAKEKGNEPEVQRLQDELEQDFARVKGEIFKKVSEAGAYAYARVVTSEATGKRFEKQLKAFEAAPEIFKRQQRLAVLEETLPDIRKYIVVAGQDDSQVYIVDLQEVLSPELYDISIDEVTGQ